MACARPGPDGGQGKKLTAIARAIHEPRRQQSDDTGIGIPDRARASFDHDNPAAVEVWEEHAEVARFFSGLQCPWRFAPMGGVVGLDYVQVRAAMNLSGIKRKRRAALLDDLLVMAEAAKLLLNERKP